MAYYIYDIETYPNIFTLIAKEFDTQNDYEVFEISWRKNEAVRLRNFLLYLKQHKHQMVGFNNLGFDYPVLHKLLTHYSSLKNELDLCYQLFQKAKSIIDTPFENRFSNIVWENDQVVSQIDLFKVHHFDNPARSTSLKVLEFNMRMQNIKDLPFPPNSFLGWDDMDTLIEYNKHDVLATGMFCRKSLGALEFRDKISKKYGVNNMNYNDTKIGKELFIRELEKSSPGSCYKKVNGKRTPNQTPRDIIHFKDILLPYIRFEHPEFQRVHDWFKNNSIINTKGELGDLNCTVNGFTFYYGTGGIHGSISPGVVENDDDFIIDSRDVRSYYPALAIANQLYPQHLGIKFCEIYEKLFKERQQYPKGTVENKALKLALNGVYGDSNNQYSPFYDPQYTMTITINGQLLLSMLAEQLMKVPGLTMCMINTDGLECRYHKQYIDHVNNVCAWWESLTKLELESSRYKRLSIRDVNNYIGEYPGGKVKRKGAYEFENLDWNKNMSALVVPKAVDHVIRTGGDLRQFIENHNDPYDFLLRTKVPRNSRLVAVDYDGEDEPIQNVSRYFISIFGSDLVKVMPPTKNQLKKNCHAPDRRIGINVGYKVTIVNDIFDLDENLTEQLEFEWYIKEARKLIDPIMKGD